MLELLEDIFFIRIRVFSKKRKILSTKTTLSLYEAHQKNLNSSLNSLFSIGKLDRDAVEFDA